MVLDSSMIMVPFEFSLALDDELRRLLGRCRVVVPRPVVRELEVLSQRGKGKKKRLAKSCLQLIQRYETVEVDAEQGDDAVVMLAKQLGAMVATNDRALRKRLREVSVPVIFLRGKQQLWVD